MTKRTYCQNCNLTTHSYIGKCTYCGKRKVEEWERRATQKDPTQPIQSGLTDENFKEIAGFLFVVLLFMLLAGGIAITVTVLG